MSKFRKYNLNPDTLVYEEARTPARRRFARSLGVLLMSFAMAMIYLWLWFGVFHLEAPKTSILKRQNARWNARVAVLNRALDRHEEDLEALEMRDEGVYRTIFGMNPIPQELLNSGFVGANRYNYFENLSDEGVLKDTYIRLDRLTKRTYIQSKACDEVAALSKRAGDMASCLPAIPPIAPVKGNYHMSSPFGGRSDPISGAYRQHEGVDIAAKSGTPVYCTGDGVVERVNFKYYGYGNMVIINHGFGYVTRYAHLHTVNVVEGMKIRRGECIGTVGATGKATGPHVHYEVRYKDTPVNPGNYFDMDMPVEEYRRMTAEAGATGEAILDPNYRHRL